MDNYDKNFENFLTYTLKIDCNKATQRFILRNALYYIKDNTDFEIKPEKVAHNFNCSYKFFNKKLYALTGYKWVELLRYIKLYNSSIILKEKKYSKVYEIPKMVGYQNYGHWTKNFTLFFGVTPSKYSRRYSKKSAISMNKGL